MTEVDHEERMDVAQQFRIVRSTKRLLHRLGTARERAEVTIKWWAFCFGLTAIMCGLALAILLLRVGQWPR